MNTFKRFGFFLAISALCFWACQLTQEGKTEDTASFTKLYDTLSGFDETFIVFKNPDGTLLDTVYQGKVDTLAEIQNLPVRGWDGGKVLIDIEGFVDGKSVFKVEKAFDGATDRTDSTIVIITPGASLTLAQAEVSIPEGDSVPKPSVNVSPSILKDKSLSWESSHTDIVLPGATHLKALQPGSARITVTLVADPSRSAFLDVTVTEKAAVLERISLSPESATVSAGGAPLRLTAVPHPVDAKALVSWHSGDSTRLTVSTDGQVLGLKKGIVTVRAESKANPLLSDSAVITIKDSVAVESVRFVKNPLELSVGDVESLLVEIFPPEANPTVDFTIANTAILSFQNNRITAKAEGRTEVIAKSRENTSRTDTLRVTVQKVKQPAPDTTAPNAPKLAGASPTGNAPKWTWSSGGGGGSGTYRYKLGLAGDAVGATETKDTTYVLATATSGTTYTLNVQERDSAGNWSAFASLAVKYDLTKPTVAIGAPLASGTYFTSAGTVALSGTSTGPNAIEKITYSVDGGEPANAVPGAAGAWSIASIALGAEKTYVITVTATDVLGNSGEASLSILRDNTQPSTPISLSTPTTPTNVNKVSWTWMPGNDEAGGSGLNGQYRHNINGGTWIITPTAAATSIPLVEGKNTFSVQEQDKSGNWSASATRDVVLDTKIPDAVTFTGTDGSYTVSQMPTWKWAPSSTNGGVGIYVLKLDAEAEFEWSSTTFTPIKALSDNQTHTLIVRERDHVAEVVGAAKSFSYKIKVIPPGAPIVKSAASGVVNNGNTNNPKFTWTSGGGGKGVYRVRLNTQTTYQTHPQTGGTQTDWTLPANAADATYTLYVSEQDDAGNWGEEGSFTIKLDRTGPAFTDVIVMGGGYVLREGYITNKASIGISFKADGVAKDTTCALSVDNGANACKITAKDALGNQATLTRNVWRRSKVIFVREGGIGNGSSWEEASGDLPGIIESSANIGREIWVATGNYGALYGSDDKTIYGGFNASQFPTTTSGRNLAGTLIDGHQMDFSGFQRFDGVVFTGVLNVRIGTLTCQDCRFEPTAKNDYAVNVIDGGNFIGNNILIADREFNNAAISVYGKATINGGSIVNNQSDGGMPIVMSGDVRFTGDLNVYGNDGLETGPYQALVRSGNFIVDEGVTMSCNTISKEDGTVTCGGRQQ